MYYVYSLKCKDGFYIGCTDNIQDRLERLMGTGNLDFITNFLDGNRGM